MFLSLPASDHACEQNRLPTPFEHILHDHLFGRGAESFDSKQHIPHFINQWTAMDPGSFWFARKDVRHFVANSLNEVQRDGHDLHWHTYTPEVIQQTLVAGFWFAGHGIEFVHAEHHGGAIYLVARKLPRPKEAPDFLRPYHHRLVSAAERLLRAPERV